MESEDADEDEKAYLIVNNDSNDNDRIEIREKPIVEVGGWAGVKSLLGQVSLHYKITTTKTIT